MNWETVKSSAVVITTSDGEVCGAGTVVSAQGHVVTCAHVIEVAGGVSQARVGQQALEPVYVGNAERDDLAVVRLSGYHGAAAPLATRYELMDRCLAPALVRDGPEAESVDGVITGSGAHPDFGGLPMLKLKLKHGRRMDRAIYSGAPVFGGECQAVVGFIATCDERGTALAIPVATMLEEWPEGATLVDVCSAAQEWPEPHARSASVFISYRSQDPDLSLAQRFFEELRGASHQPFMAGESIRLGEDWPRRIDEELERCDYFLLLLSPRSATSEMVTEEVRRVKLLRDSRQDGRPMILPIRVNLPIDEPLNYDLAGYLSRIQQREWRSPDDTPVLLEEIRTILSGDARPDVESGAAPSPASLAYDGELRRPLPVAEPELPGGQVDLSSRFYVGRPPIEASCFAAIGKPGSLIRIRAPRQMGKTSLLARTLHEARAQGNRTVSQSFQLADSSVFGELDDLMQWFCSSVTWELGLPDRVPEHWQQSIAGSKMKATAYFQRHVLTNVEEPICLGLDEVDLVFQHLTVAGDFFGLLRGWHEKSKSDDLWKKLRMIVVHSTEVYIPLKMNESPFNVGLPIELPEFTRDQVLDLAKRHGLAWSVRDVDRLTSMIGGHPYLVRVALYHLAHESADIETLLESAPTEAGLYGDHLRRHLWNLDQHSELAAAMCKVVNAQDSVSLRSDEAFKLESMGLVRRKENSVSPRCELYRLYFRDRLRTVQ